VATEDPSIPADVRALIAQRIDSVAQLEVLLLLHADPARAWPADEVARELRIEPAGAQTQLDDLVRRGLVRATATPPAAAPPGGAAPQRFAYGPASGHLSSTVDALARAYADRRVAVISLIYSKPPDPVRTFADAFRFRDRDRDRDDDDDDDDDRREPRRG